MARWSASSRTRDMFGRPSKAAVTSPGQSSAPPTGASAPPTSVDERPVPAWMVPWLIPAFVVFAFVIIAVAPALVAIGVVLLVFTVIAVKLYRVNKRLTYEEIRSRDPLFRGWDDFRHGRGYRGLDSDDPAH